MKKMLQLEVIGRKEAAVGYDYILSITTTEKFEVGDTMKVSFNHGRMTRQAILDGIFRVFGFDWDEFMSKCSDMKHTYARKVYAILRREMGVGVGDIALELNKANASVAYYLSDNSVKVREYCDAVRNG